jgi:LPS sulfotransferase NodH
LGTPTLFRENLSRDGSCATGLLDPRNGAAWDLPPFAGEVSTYIVASTPRTGSTLLCRLLWDTGLVGAPKEYLNPMQIRDWEVRLGGTGWTRWRNRLLFGPAVALAGRGRWSEARLHEHIARVRERRTSAGGLFGLKLHEHHFARFFGSGCFDLESALAPRRWIRLRREDTVAQAVSWARALQSGRWASHQRFALPVVYRRNQIARLEQEIGGQEAAWENFFASCEDEYLPITYEELSTDRVAVVRRVLDFLGVEGAMQVPVPEPGLQAQADATNAAWIARYRSLRAE